MHLQSKRPAPAKTTICTLKLPFSGMVFEDTEDIHVKVIDWGLGFYFKRAHMKTSVGTSAYAAPEVQRPVPR